VYLVCPCVCRPQENTIAASKRTFP
jgi:hypothetical protein